MSLEVYPQSGPPGPIGPTASVLFSAGSLSSVRSDITFNNSNGVTFGLDAGGVITATVQTNYQSAGAYLTTAALSQDSSKYAGTTAGMTGGSLTVDTAGVAISLPAYLTTAQPPGAYLTTAMASNRGSDFVQATAGFFGTNATGTIASNAISISVNPGGGGSLNISAGSTSSNVSAVTFSNGSGVTFGFDGSNVTASVQTNYQTPGAYLTTAALSQDSSKYAGTGFTSASTAGSNIVGTLNTSGLSVGIPNYLTTAQPPGAYLTTAALSQDSSKYAGTNGSVETTSGTDLALTLNTSGATIAYPKWLTTAMQSNAATISNINVSAGSTSGNVSAVTFSNANGVSFGYDGTNVTATVATNYQSQGAYLTTAALSQDSSKYAGTGFTTATTAGTNVVGTLNTSGLSMGIPAYLTTTPAGGAGTGFTSTSTAGSNVVGTLNSNGLSVGVPNYLTTAMASNAVTISNILFSADDTKTGSSIRFVNNGNVSFGWATGLFSNQNALSAEVLFKVSAGTLGKLATGISFQDSNGVSWGNSAATQTSISNYAQITASVRTNYAGTATSVATTSGTDLSFAANTSGITIAYPAWLTTAGGASVVQSLNGSTGQLSISGSGLNSVSNTASTIIVSARSESLNEIQNPAADAVFSMGSNAAFFSFNQGGSFSTNATREGMFQISVAGNVSQEADVFRLWQGGGSPTTLDMLHIEAGGTNVTALRLQNSASVAGEFNNPIKFTTADTNFSIGSVPMILGTGMSNLVSNLNANYLQGSLASQFAASNVTSGRAGTNTSVATTSGTDLTLGVNTSGVTIGYPKWITTYVNDLTSGRAGTATSVVTTSGTDLSMALNTNGLTVAYPKWITTAAAGGGVAISNSQTLFSTGTVALSEGGGAITIASSAGGQSLMFSVPQTSSIVGTNGISISTTGSTISVSNIGPKFSAGTLSANRSDITFSDSGGVSWGLNTNGVITATVATNYQSAGAYLTTAAQSSAMMSWFQNMDMLDPGSTVMSYGGSVLQVCPFILPAAMSVGFVRMAGSMSYVSTEVSGTTANSTWTVNRSYSHAVMLFTQNTGVNSLSLNLLTSSSASWLFQNQIGAGAQGSRYTVTQNVTYPISGTTSNYTTSYPQSSANIQISSASLTLFTGPRFIDIPFGVSLPANNYWIAFGMSTNSATQAGNAALGGASAGFSLIAVTQNNISFGLMGQVTNSSNGIQPGFGSWSTNSAVMTTNSIALANVSAMSSNPHNYFQFIRYA